MGSLEFIHSDLIQELGAYVQKYRWANLSNLNSSRRMKYEYDKCVGGRNRRVLLMKFRISNGSEE